MRAALEDRDDVRAYDRAKAKDQEMVPAAIADRLLTGENPIRVWREHRHLTQDKLAFEAAIANPYLSQIETGKRSASVDVLRRLARVLRLELDDIAPEIASRATVRAFQAKISRQPISHQGAKAIARVGAARPNKR
jgi:transcriptional regulator with XRE-family HTH domain